MRESKADILRDIGKEYIKARVVGGNTLEVFYKDGSKAIRYHHTDVITWLSNGNVVLDSGGWHTSTTKERITEYSPYYIMQRNYIWYVMPRPTIKSNWNPKSPDFKGNVFYDGITLDSGGNLKSNPKVINEKATDKLKRRINKYCDLINKVDSLPQPSNGDCWYCSLISQEGKPLGDTTKNNSHLLEHLKEGYLHGSILVNSMREAGYSDSQIGIHYQMDWKDSFRRSLYKYLVKRLIQV